MTNNFIIGGSTIGFNTDPNIKIVNQLPAGAYNLTETKKGFLLSPRPMFSQSPKLYGDFEKYANRILTTYKQRERNTGVLLSGVKGSGKSEMLRLISNLGAKENIPTITINTAIEDVRALFMFLGEIQQPMIVALDEFDKSFSDVKVQEAMLSHLDGTSVGTGQLFVLTVNDENKLSNYLLNRPGRIYYKRDFTILSNEIIEDYSKQNLKGWTQARMDGIWEAVAYVESVSFDILKALIEEMNRYGEDARTAMGYLNAAPQVNLLFTYKQKSFFEGNSVLCSWPGGSESRNPLTQQTRIVLHPTRNEEIPLVCGEETLTHADYKNGVYTFEEGPAKVILTRTRDFNFKI